MKRSSAAQAAWVLEASEERARIGTYRSAEVQKLNHVQASFAALYLGNEGLRTAKAVGKGLLGHASGFPRSLKGFDERLILLVVDASRQPLIPFDRV